MPPAPIPPNESARLAALNAYNVLDTDPEADFDDLTALAAQICGTPIALVSLVDANRQWFKSRHGLDMAETHRDYSYCAYTILEAEPLVVPDALADERFADNPLASSDPNVRFYAGVPLQTPDGQVLGSFCVIDHTPRELSSEQLDALRILGRQVIAQLELRRAAREQARLLAETLEERRRLDELMATVPGTVWEHWLEPESHPERINYVSTRITALTGYTPEEWLAEPDFWLTITHPADQERAEQQLKALLAAEASGVLQHRWISKDGRTLWVETQVTVVRDAAGAAIGLRAVTTDISERRQAEIERAQLQEEIIQIQAATLAEISTPLIPLSDDVLVMPLIGAIDTQRAQNVLTALLEGIERSRARAVILDITGVAVVDTQVANGLIRAAQAVQLLGAQVILTGIRPEVAQTLVGLNVNLTGIVTLATLQRGVQFALHLIDQGETRVG